MLEYFRIILPRHMMLLFIFFVFPVIQCVSQVCTSLSDDIKKKEESDKIAKMR